MDFYRCRERAYLNALESATREQALEAVLDGVGRQAGVAAHKHALMRIAVVLTVVGGIAAMVLLIFSRPVAPPTLRR